MSKRFYVAIVVLLVALMVLSFLPIHGEREVYDTVVRLHVLANSDSSEDQTLKLQVRDAVLRVSAPLVEDCTTQAQAVDALSSHLEELTSAAREEIRSQGYDYPVTVLLGEESYPTRVYESCAFPAGEYVSLRVCIGAARGENWWCCLFPPLCLSSATSTARNQEAFLQTGLTKEQYGIITETDKVKYKVRFKLLEVLEAWLN